MFTNRRMDTEHVCSVNMWHEATFPTTGKRQQTKKPVDSDCGNHASVPLCAPRTSPADRTTMLQ